MARTGVVWIVSLAALSVAPVDAMGGGETDISWTQVSQLTQSTWLVSISLDSWEEIKTREIKTQMGSGLEATAARVDRVFSENTEVWHLAYLWSPRVASVWHDICYVCEHNVIKKELGSCFADVIEKTQSSSGRFSCSPNARELKAAVDRYATSPSRTKGVIMKFPGAKSSWVFPDGAVPGGWNEGALPDDWPALLLGHGFVPSDLMSVDGIIPDDWVSRMFLEYELLPEGWMFTEHAQQKARMYLDGGIADGWMFRPGLVFSEDALPPGWMSLPYWIAGELREFPRTRTGDFSGRARWLDPPSSIVDAYFERGIQEGWISSSASASVITGAGAIFPHETSTQGWMFSESRLFPEGRTFPKGGILPEHGDWWLKRAKLFQLDERAANTRVSFGWLTEPVEYELEIGNVTFGEDNAGALTMYVPGFSIDLRWDPEQLGGSGLFAQVYGANGLLHEKDGRKFSFELPSTVASSFQNELANDSELRINLRVDPTVGEVAVKDPWGADHWWGIKLGESIAEGSIGVGTKSLSASFGNFSVSP